ncbi:diguanylate cyclase domain-containing protein [Sphingomonas lycopersici]|uniref:Diguanylate cyclase n=1 Tax=Sphingomonas lycopersici TaxID=2951807 RepID=A0AA42CRU9_9SPHN|nr:diguanylate cyclase [Sphingomonas lycopersici]MCW6537095.1 diguanylate cyclase [Sphingomonas lycopersici]
MSAERLPTLGRALARVQQRTMLLTLLLALAGSLLSGVLMVDSYVRQNMRLIGQLAGYSVEPAVVFHDQTAIDDAIRPLLTRGDGVRAVVVTAGGLRVEVRHPEDEAHSTIGSLKDRTAALLWPEPAITRIDHAGRPIGDVRVYAGLGGLDGYLMLGFADGVGALMLAVLLTYPMVRRLHRRIAEPIGAIAAIAHRVQTERALHLRAPRAPIAEIDSLGHDFNALLAELEGWQAHLARENETLAHRAMHDPLTGLANRVVLEERLASELKLAAAAEAGLGVLYIDANRFKEINDQFGHAAGDRLLIEIAARLRGALRQSDLAARVGGDEFAVLIAPPAGPEETQALAARIRATMTPPLVLPGGERIAVSISLGAANFPEDGRDIATLLNAADRAMYADKRAAPGPTIAVVRQSYKPS